MSAHFAEQHFDGFAQWMKRQADEEMGHAMKLFDYVLERCGHVELTALAAPAKKLGTPLKVFQAARGRPSRRRVLPHSGIASADPGGRPDLDPGGTSREAASTRAKPAVDGG